MAKLHEIPAFPYPGVRLIKEDEHVAIWEEVFEPGEPTQPHRHMRDYIVAYPHGGELTVIPLAGEPEEFTTLAGEYQESASANGGVRLVFSAGAMFHGRVPAEGSAHYAVNEGQKPTRMILIEIKGTETKAKEK